LKSSDFPGSSEASVSSPAATLLSPDANVKANIVKRLSETTPEEVATRYYRSIQTWFPIISFSELCERLPRTWDEASLDMSLLFMSMSLLTETVTAPAATGRTGLPQALESAYLSLKSWIAIFEGLGTNSSDFLHARLLLVLFEVVHGNFPAAYISMGSLFHAAEALEMEKEELNNGNSDTWWGILILDR
jgi:hypothetical protein